MKKREPIYNFSRTVKENDKDKVFEIQLRSPTRSQLNDADMFYSIRLSKYIRDGLLTSEQIQKRQIDVGGTFTEEQQRQYTKFQVLLAEKRELLMRIMAKAPDQLAEEERERKRILSEDIGILIGQIQEYEFVRNTIFEHSANAKARNDVLLWWILNLTQFAEIVEGKEAEFKPMFTGEDFDSKKMSLEQMQDDESELLTSSFDELTRTVTIWYWMGVTDKTELSKLVKQSDSPVAETAPKKEENAAATGEPAAPSA